MKRIKIIGDGWDSFNGKMGGVQFVNGVSAREVTPKEARRIGGNIRIEDAENEGVQLGGVTEHNGGVPAAPPFVPDREHEKEVVKPERKAKEVEPVKEKPDLPIYTQDDLEVIASSKGIKGVREIAQHYDVKGVQINQLIAGILQAQGK